jgi:hypothetical protein
MRRWVAEDLHRTLTAAAHHMADHLLDCLPGHRSDTGALLDDLHYHAGLLNCRLAEHPTTDPATETATGKDAI